MGERRRDREQKDEMDPFLIRLPSVANRVCFFSLQFSFLLHVCEGVCLPLHICGGQKDYMQELVLSLPCGSSGLNSSCQFGQQTPLPTELSLRPVTPDFDIVPPAGCVCPLRDEERCTQPSPFQL